MAGLNAHGARTAGIFGGINQNLRSTHTGMNRTGRAANALGGPLSRLVGWGQSVRSSMGGVGKTLGGVQKGLGSVRGVLTGMTVGSAVGAGFLSLLVGTNAALEQQRMTMAALINANVQFRDSQGKNLTNTQNFQESMKVSRKLTDQFRRDAITSPGTSKDLMELASQSMQPVLSSGGSIETVRQLSKEALSVATVFGTDIPQASRDLAQMLTGRAGADVKTFSLLKPFLGDAEQFNKLDPTTRLIKLRSAMQKIATPELIAAQSRTFQGLTSSIQEFAEIASTKLGGKLFDRVKQKLGQLVDAILTKDGELTPLGKRLEKNLTDAGEAIGVGFDTAMRVLGVFWGKAQLVWGWITGSAVPIFTRELIPAIEYFSNLWSQANDLVGGSSGDWTSMSDNIARGAAVLTKIVFAGGNFIALGLATILWGVGAASEHVGKVLERINKKWPLYGDGIRGWGQAFRKVLSEMWTDFQKWVKDVDSKARETPVIGGLLGWVADHVGTEYKDPQDLINRRKQGNGFVGGVGSTYKDPPALLQARARVIPQTSFSSGPGITRTFFPPAIPGNRSTSSTPGPSAPGSSFMTTVNVTNVIKSTDPVQAGQTAAFNTGKAVSGALGPIVGQPITQTKR